MEDSLEKITAPVDARGTPEKASGEVTKKDPKKVAARKALARKNKEAREARLKLEGRRQVEAQSSPLFDTFRNASILVGSALVLYHGYQAFNTAFGKKRVEPPVPEPVKGSKEENSIQME